MSAAAYPTAWRPPPFLATRARQNVAIVLALAYCVWAVSGLNIDPQRALAGFGRALMQDPDLLLVDEPTASLDPKTARQIMRLIRELAVERRRPALVNIHDVALAQSFADRVIGLKEGRVTFDGSPATLTPAVLTEIYGAEDWSQTIRRVDDEEREDAA